MSDFTVPELENLLAEVNAKGARQRPLDKERTVSLITQSIARENDRMRRSGSTS